MEYYIHYTHGRMRIQSPLLQDNTARAKEFETFIRTIDGVTSVETHTVTGSGLILFDEHRLNCEQLICILETNRWFSLLRAETNDEVVEKTAEKVLDVAEKIVVDALGEGEAGT